MKLSAGLSTALLAVLGANCLAQAQPADPQDGPALLSDSARVSLITILPGEKVYSLFGHNALRVVDPARGIDIAYNYGTFHFGNPLAFSAKFAYGDLNYRLARQSYRRMVDYYPSVEERPILEQWLALDGGQREALYRFLEWNALPENASYRYDFYYDNCATRIRDVLENLLGAGLQTDAGDPDRTMRQLLDPYLVEKPMLHVGMDFAQGVPADAPATARDALFLPEYLAAWVEGARLREPDGARSLVARTDSIGWTAERARLETKPPWPIWAFTALLLGVVWLTAADVRTGRPARPWLDGPLYGFLGIAGLFVAFVWFFSLHEVARRNINILWVLPTHLALAWTLVKGQGASRPSAEPTRGSWSRRYLWVTAGLAAVFLAGLPWWTQEVPTALVPLALAAAVRSAGLAIVRTPGRGEAGTGPRADSTRSAPAGGPA